MSLLDNLQGEPRGVLDRDSAALTDDEWREVLAARSKGYSWKQLHEAINRHKNLATFITCAHRARSRVGGPGEAILPDMLRAF